jgi:hypothetical protein
MLAQGEVIGHANFTLNTKVSAIAKLHCNTDFVSFFLGLSEGYKHQGHRMSFNTDSIGSASSKSSTIHMNFT